MSIIYPGDLSESEWKHLQQHLPSQSSCGRPRTHSLREICNAIFYVQRTGCSWRYLPSNFPPWQTVFYHFWRWRLKGNWYQLLTALRVAERERVGRNAEPSAAIIDSQSVKTVEESASSSGFDAHKHIKGRNWPPTYRESEWGTVFTDARLIAAIVDRVTFNAYIIETGIWS
jgi:putative transposase